MKLRPSALPYLALAVPDAPEVPRARLLAALCAMLPRVGVAEDGAFLCDLRGTERLLGPAMGIARRAIDACARAGAAPAAGIAITPFIARLAARDAAPGTVRQIAAGTERPFTDPLPLAALPLHPRVVAELGLLGLPRVGDFLALPAGAVLERFGAAAARVQALAAGRICEDIGGIAPPRRIRARRLWDEPIDSRERLVFALRAAADEVAAALRTDGLAALEIVVVLGREGRGPVRLVRSLLPPTADPAAIIRSIRWGLEELSEATDIGAVNAASLEVSVVEPSRGRQVGLFAPDGARAEEAIAVAQFLRTRLGRGAVLEARVVDPQARLPERGAVWRELVR
ncbi:MAG TPA: hypothetical protein VM070_03520 [Candidatus Saccharimonadales bacterium]|nr:hypothetical protein [Candidatus Saccharimonadales bacterium]